MALFDEDRNDVVLVVTFLGPAGSGKRPTLSALHSRSEAAGQIVVPWEEEDSIVRFEYRPNTDRRHKSRGVRLMLQTLTGPVKWSGGKSKVDDTLDFLDVIVVMA